MPTLQSSSSPETASPSSTSTEAQTSVSYPSAPPRDENGNCLALSGSLTDWARVGRAIAKDLPIPYDPEDGPYDPNDDEAVEAYWKDALIVRSDGTILQQPGPTESPKTVL